MAAVTLHVAVRGDSTAPTVATLTASDDATLVGDAAAADIVVAVGDAGLRAAALSDVAPAAQPPVVPVDVDAAPDSVAPADTTDAIAAVAAGSYTVVDHPTFDVTTPTTDARAIADVSLMTTAPAKISEYTVSTPDRTVASVRADGIVAATPLGSHGYAADAGAPHLAPGVSAAAVVPVSPFRVDRTNWVVCPPVSVTVARDETTVELHADGHAHGRVPVDSPVTLSWGTPLPIAVVSHAGTHGD